MKIKRSILVFALLTTTVIITTVTIHNYLNYDPQSKCELIEDKTIYLAIDETIDIEGAILNKDEEILKLVENKIKAIKKGTTTVKANCTTYNVIVSDLYTLPIIDNDKQFLPCNYFSKQDNIFLDNILSLKINEKGYKTRAAAVEAARFLLLQFKYKINYFYENGRLENINGETYCDAEGRYYHTGLYLNEYKYDELDEDGIVNGPSIWGCDLKSDSNDGIISPNGLDCSGFITWCLYNAGYDPKDIGAGITRKVKDLTNLGKLIYLEDLDYENIKVGDLIGFIGHIGMVIVKDEDGIYIGEVYWENDSNCKYYKYEDLKKSEWDYIIDMDKFYKEDGKLENMW